MLAESDAALAGVLALLRESFAELPGSPSARLELADLQRMAGAGTGLVLEEGGAPVACVFLRDSRDVPGALYLGSLAVAAPARGRGLAGGLIGAAAEIGRERGYGALTLDTGARLRHLVRLFQRAGFVVAQERGGVVQMRRNLAYRVMAEGGEGAALLGLIRAAFAPMQGRIDPPSSVVRLDAAALRAQAESGEIWAIGTPPVACVFLTPRESGLYIGKLAVEAGARGRGLGRYLLELAAERARALGLKRLELKARVELEENHGFFRAAGFRQVGAEAHPGFDRATTLLFARELGI